MEKECEEFSFLWFYAGQRRTLSFNKNVEAYNYIVRGIKFRDEPLKYQWPKPDTAYCRQMVQRDMALIRVRYDSRTFMRSKKSVRMSFTDRISSFGEFVPGW